MAKSTIFSSDRFVLAAAFLLAGLFTVPPAQALTEPVRVATMQELLAMSFDELLEVKVISATGTPKAAKLAPSVATVISKADIERIGARTLDEALETVPGLHVIPSGYTYLSSTWSMRGMYTNVNPHVLLLINGVPKKDPQAGNRGYGFQMQTAMIERIEVIRGPGSALYGADAFAGVINVITKHGGDINGTRMAGRAGSFDTYGAMLQHGNVYDGWDVAVGIEWQKTQGDHGRIIERDALGRGSPSLTPTGVDTRAERLDGNLALAKGNWQGQVYASLQDSALGTGGLQVVTYGNDVDRKELVGNLVYTNTDRQDWAFSSRLWGHYQYADIFLQYYPTEYRNMLGNPIVISKVGGLDSAVTFSGIDRHRLRAGIGIQYTDTDIKQYRNFGTGVAVQFGELVNVTDTPYMFMNNQHRRLWYGLLQEEWAFAKSWELTAGLRYDDYDDFGSTINPRLALVWETRDSLTTKLLYGRAFRPPTFGDLHNQNNPVANGNPNLDPETIQTGELVFDFRPTKKLSTGLNLFFYEINGLIDYQFDPAPATTKTAQNMRDQTGYGFEVEADWLVTTTIRLKSDFAYQRSKDKETKAPVPDAPGMKLHINPQWSFLHNWLLDTHFYWIADRHRVATDTRPAIADYELVNLKLTRSHLFTNWDLSLTVHNLFDENVLEPSDGRIPGDYPMEGRGAWVEVLAHF